MEWYVGGIVGWFACGCVALAMQFRDRPAMGENVGLAELWPVVLGPLWLIAKVYEWAWIGRTH